eukprot:GHVR01125283.1.p1 GENE.GHVR01125283.1~~GHVR01125283.1.p1  ORF type:complete len:257 (-),score=37.73 GHVR01125283.1:68-838(-)
MCVCVYVCVLCVCSLCVKVFKYSIISEHQTQLFIENSISDELNIKDESDYAFIDVNENWSKVTYTFDSDWVSVTGFDMFYKKTIVSKLTLRRFLLSLSEECTEIIVKAVETGRHPLTDLYNQCIIKLKNNNYNLVYRVDLGEGYEFNESLFDDDSYDSLMEKMESRMKFFSIIGKNESIYGKNPYVYMPDFWRIRVPYHKGINAEYLTVLGSNLLENYLIDSVNYLYFYAPIYYINTKEVRKNFKFTLMTSKKKNK